MCIRDSIKAFEQTGEIGDLIMLYGAVIGDVLGSTFEFNNWLKSPEELPIFPPDAHPTDDSVLTCAVADALIASAVRDDVSENTLRVDPVQFQRKVRGALRDWGGTFPKAGYGSRFMRWMLSDTEAPTGSLGNGSAMRASGCAWAAGSLSEALELAAFSALQRIITRKALRALRLPCGSSIACVKALIPKTFAANGMVCGASRSANCLN